MYEITRDNKSYTADDVLMGGTKNCISSAFFKGGFPSITGTYLLRFPNLGNRTKRLVPLTIYLRSNQTMEKWNYPILFFSCTKPTYHSHKIKTLLVEFKFYTLNHFHKVDKTQFDGYTIFINLSLDIENFDTAFY